MILGHTDTHPNLILSLVLRSSSACRTDSIFSISSSVRKLRSSNGGSPLLLVHSLGKPSAFDVWGVTGTIDRVRRVYEDAIVDCLQLTTLILLS